VFYRHAGENRHPEGIEIPGFRVALAIASLPGMTIDLCNELRSQDTSLMVIYFLTPSGLMRQFLLKNAAVDSTEDGKICRRRRCL